ncbi:hypothetical protein UFOVP51_9 [uncultured Caudovirales phage]|uniref:Uncharacterized protein n=1 Tax=uncultured Caudovirales phage TaxID=2100421 RepID=A0A6J5T9A5_9CAUD|nr:hypothetical protein UFOVP51_9 [uncultured Caudovirales phage]CAB4240745.1 hypothetical protein UFOVP34_11 [uncultured Caudovirales phage]
MPSKRKASLISAAPVAAALPTSDYKTFLASLINKPPTKLKAAAINKWRDIPATSQGQIVNDIAKKFNSNIPSIGIQNVKYTRGAGQPNYYEGATAMGNTQMTLAPPPHGKVPEGPNPITVGHELMHANDHQSNLPTGQLNPLVWQNLGKLATTGGTPGARNVPTPMNNFADFSTSVGKIQDKIAPGGEFKPNPAFPGSGYPINQAYIEHEIQGATGNPYQTPFVGRGINRSPDWTQLFTDINNAVNTQNPLSTVANPLPPNRGFYLNRASEFPAFMSERLTQPWGGNINTAPAGQPSNALSRSEARFVHSTLGDMSTAYPANDPTTGNPAYPTMNQHIGARRNSIADAYYPPQPGGAPGSGVPATGFSKGGKIKAKSKKRGLFSYFKG